jgi:predicted TIM-barrel fold metal-dependent hydrolase
VAIAAGAIAIAPAVLRSAQASEGRAAEGVSFRLFDAHVHLVADDKRKYPRGGGGNPPPSGGGLPPGVGGQPGGSAGNSVRAEPDVERVIHWMDEQGVEGGAAVQKRGTYGYDNSYILDSADLHKDRLAPVVVLDAQDAKTPQLVRDLVKKRGLAALRLTGGPAADGSFPWLSSPAALNTWAVAEETGVVMDLMITSSGPSPAGIAEIIKLAQRFPKARLVLDHVAYPNPQGGPEYGIDIIHRSLAQYRNIYYKFTIINLDLLREAKVPAADFVRRIVDVYGADRVMWGSDVGNSAGTYQELVSRIVAATAKLDDSEKRMVLHDTGKSVFVRGGHSL